jgi:sugar lactone lactonase YvrE
MPGTRRKNITALFFIVIALAGIGFFVVRSATNTSGPSTAGKTTSAPRVSDAALLYTESDRILLDEIEIPKCIAVDREGRIYVAGGKKVASTNADGAPVNVLFELDLEPSCIAVGTAGEIYLGMGNHVRVFRAGGVPEQWPDLDEKAFITSISETPGGVFVADAGTRRVWRFNRSGRLLDWIEGGNGSLHFLIPSPYFDLAAGDGDRLWITNPGRHRVECYSLEGELLSSWGEYSRDLTGFQGCCNPSHIAALPDGQLVVSEKGLPRIKTYNQLGELTGLVADSRHIKAAGIGLDLATDSEGNIYVVDPKLPGLRIFKKKG